MKKFSISAMILFLVFLSGCVDGNADYFSADPDEVSARSADFQDDVLTNSDGGVERKTPVRKKFWRDDEITRAKAIEIALFHAGLEENDVADLRVQLDDDDGRMEYAVEFDADSVKYRYGIDAVTGEIVHAVTEEEIVAEEMPGTVTGESAAYGQAEGAL